MVGFAAEKGVTKQEDIVKGKHTSASGKLARIARKMRRGRKMSPGAVNRLKKFENSEGTKNIIDLTKCEVRITGHAHGGKNGRPPTFSFLFCDSVDRASIIGGLRITPQQWEEMKRKGDALFGPCLLVT